MEPLVTVAIPTKDEQRNIQNIIKSVHSQTYKNIEIIIVDNSTDSTPQLAEEMGAQVVSLKGRPERSVQRNLCIEKANGEFVLLVDADMILTEKVVEDCVAKMLSDDTLVGLVIPEESIGTSFWARCKKLEKSFYVGIEWMEAARFFPKKILEKAGGYSKTLISGEDWDLSQRIGEFGKIGRVSSVIYHNEWDLSLVKIIQKKFYYSQKIYSYISSGSKHFVQNQTSLLLRFKLYFSNPKKLFADPVLGLGMLFMRFLELSAGTLGMFITRLKKK